ncbi:glycosyltransferase [Flavilitoribacter nigricans]|uniref:Glycosyltransferase n=1 Tax=Flavilitoribacter nigricans (strain ATCC 23147 / DSM 23189 / NBRC 102662 / NCIMB 1420 / SS-2) TaxID=1122177 RepID=A0A2D0MZ36_FLAN2|nr:glycosyltransferase [Flavilitoribacter nigricans]PHN01487.1 hypothetical protein CRP01_36920 [Flavilitoribacter nigricans DSM 23189 = NBRC 102662]
MENRRRKILIIIPSLVAGGAERVLINILNLIDHNKFDIKLYVVINKGKLFDDLPNHVKPSFIFPSPVFERIASYLYRKYGLELFYKIWGKEIEGDYDVGISFLDGSNSQFLFYAKGNIHRKIVVVHSSYLSFKNVSRSIFSSHIKRMKRRYNNIDTIVAVSDDSMNEFKKIFGLYPDMRVIYNPINRLDVINKSNLKVKFDYPRNKKILIAIGSLSPVKGFERLITAASKLRKDGISFQLWILGQGALQDKLSDLIEDLSLSNEVKLLGYRRNPYPYMRKADLLVTSSYSEGLPTVICEALVMSIPVISTDVSGCREVLDYGEFGMLVENNTEGLYLGIKNVLESEGNLKLLKEKAIKGGEVFDDEKAILKYTKLLSGN